MKKSQLKQLIKEVIKEYFVGQSAGYGGGAMTGGQVAPTNWAGTFSSNQTSRRLNDYPASRRYTYMQGNTVIGSSLYDTITQDDLKHPKFTPDEIMTGLKKNRVLDAITVITSQHHDSRLRMNAPSDYQSNLVSKQILRVVMSYVDYINENVWSQK